MEKNFIIYKNLDGEKLYLGAMYPVKRNCMTQTEEIDKDFHLYPLNIADGAFEKAFRQRKERYEEQFLMLRQAMEQHQPLTFTVSYVAEKAVFFTHPDFCDFTFLLPASQYIQSRLSSLDDFYRGEIYQLFVINTNTSIITLSYYCPQEGQFGMPAELSVSDTPLTTIVEQVLEDRIVVSYHGSLYTVPANALFYADTPVGIKHYEHLDHNELRLFVKGTTIFGFPSLTDKQITYSTPLSYIDPEHAPQIGSVVKGIPIHYKENVGIIVKAGHYISYLGVIPCSKLYPIRWQFAPKYFPLGVEMELEVIGISSKTEGANVTFRPVSSVENNDDENAEEIVNGGIYNVRLIRCERDDNGDVISVTGYYMAMMCHLYASSVPNELYPFLEEMTNLHMELHLCLNIINGRYICSWPTLTSSFVQRITGPQRMTVICETNRTALLKLGLSPWMAVHKFTIGELCLQKKMKLKPGTVVDLTVKRGRHDGLLEVCVDDEDIWERCTWKAGDTLIPRGKGSDVGLEICDCEGLPGIMLPHNNPFKIGNPVKVFFIDKTKHILLITTEPEMLTSADSLPEEGSKVVGGSLMNIGGVILAIKVNKQQVFVVDDLPAINFLKYYYSHKTLFDHPSLSFTIRHIKGTAFAYAKWNGSIGKKDFSDMVNGNPISVSLKEKDKYGNWIVDYQQLTGRIPKELVNAIDATTKEIIVIWRGELSSDGQMFEFLPGMIEALKDLELSIGEEIRIHHRANGEWYYNDIKVDVDWGGDIIPGINNSLLAKPLSNLDAKITANDSVFRVDGGNALRKRYDSTKWDGQGVIADMFVVGMRDEATLILAGNYGAGLLPLSSLFTEDCSQNYKYWCQEGIQIPVRMEPRDASGMMYLQPVRMLAPQKKPIEINLTDDKPTLQAKKYNNGGFVYMLQSWRECPIETGDHLWAEIVDIEKNQMIVRWQSVCILLRRNDAMPQPYYKPEELYKIGDMLDCVVNIFNPDSGRFFLKVVRDRQTILQKIDFNIGDVVDVIVVCADVCSHKLIVERNGIRGEINMPSNTKSYYNHGKTIKARCLSIDHERLAIEFCLNIEETDSQPSMVECVVSKILKKQQLIVEYNGTSIVVSTGRIHSWAFVPGDKVRGLLSQQNGDYRFTLIGFRTTSLLTGEIVSGKVISSISSGLTIDLKDGTRGIVYGGPPKLSKKYPVGSWVDYARCIYVYSKMGIVRIALNPLDSEKVYTGLNLGDEVTFTVDRVDDDALHGYVDDLYAIVPRNEAGWKYSYSSSFALQDGFSVGNKLNAKIISMDGRLVLSLKASPEESATALQTGRIVKGHIIQFVPNKGNMNLSYYLLEWDEFVGILPYSESSYQAFLPLVYVPGEEITASIIDCDDKSGMPILSYRQCNSNPLKYSELKVGDCCDAILNGFYNGNIQLTLPGGIRSFLPIKICHTRTQFEGLINQQAISVRLTEIQGKKYVVEPLHPFSQEVPIPWGKKVNVTIFQIETYQMNIRGYDAFTDDGILIWIPCHQKNDMDNLNEISINERYVVKLFNNSDSHNVKGIIVEPIVEEI